MKAILLGLILSFSALAEVSVHFNTPKSFINPDATLEEVLIQYIEGAATGSRAYMSFYQLKSNKVIDALLRAHVRGVSLNIVMDDIAREKGYAKALERLQNGLSAETLTVCVARGCLNPERNNHNKFFLFERVNLAGQELSYVTIQSSHNFKKSQTYNFNDLLVFSNRQDVFDGFKAYWEALKSQVPQLDYMGSANGVIHLADNDSTTLYFSPSTSIDPFQEELKDFNCGENGEILITQSFFSETRGRAYLATLEAIKSRYPRCRIEALVRKDNSHNDMKSEMQSSTIKFIQINRIGISNHSKMMLMKDASGVKRVLTGSMNMMDRSLIGDESVVALSNDAIYDAYRDYWHLIERRTR